MDKELWDYIYDEMTKEAISDLCYQHIRRVGFFVVWKPAMSCLGYYAEA